LLYTGLAGAGDHIIELTFEIRIVKVSVSID
jgi:hypothetical protein